MVASLVKLAAKPLAKKVVSKVAKKVIPKLAQRTIRESGEKVVKNAFELAPDVAKITDETTVTGLARSVDAKMYSETSHFAGDG